MLPTLFKTKQNKLLQSIFQSQYEKCLERNKILGMEKKSITKKKLFQIYLLTFQRVCLSMIPPLQTKQIISNVCNNHFGTTAEKAKEVSILNTNISLIFLKNRYQNRNSYQWIRDTGCYIFT